MEEEFMLDFCPNCLSAQEWSWAEQKCYFCGYHFLKLDKNPENETNKTEPES